MRERSNLTCNQEMPRERYGALEGRERERERWFIYFRFDE
jgi:hypothetical protein